ncbi:hypothetical protein BDW62DRAFT_197265 [Aspergillus aurantiobrunneus]
MSAPNDSTSSDSDLGSSFAWRGFSKAPRRKTAPTTSPRETHRKEQDCLSAAAIPLPSSVAGSVADLQSTYVSPSVEEGHDESPKRAFVPPRTESRLLSALSAPPPSNSSRRQPRLDMSSVVGSRQSSVAPGEGSNFDLIAQSNSATLASRTLSDAPAPVPPLRKPEAAFRSSVYDGIPSTERAARPSVAESVRSLRTSGPPLSPASRAPSRTPSIASSRRGVPQPSSERGTSDLPLRNLPRSTVGDDGPGDLYSASPSAVSTRRKPFSFQDEVQFPTSPAPQTPQYDREVIDMPLANILRTAPTDDSHLGTHPALVEDPSFPAAAEQSASGSRAGSIRRSRLDSQAGSVPQLGTAPEARTCTTLDTLCEECQYKRKKINMNVESNYLICGSEIYPAMVECVLMGTPDEAGEIASKLERRMGLFCRESVTVHASVRRSAAEGHRAGRWYDVTTRDYPASLSCLPSSQDSEKQRNLLEQFLYWHLAKAEEKQKEKQKAARTMFHDFRLLLDFPVPVEPRGSIERHLASGLPKNVKIIKVKFIQTHHTLHRLADSLNGREMTCTTFTNMCTQCSKEYAGILQKYPMHSISLHTGIYPVSFRGAFPETEVPFDYAIHVANRIENTLYQIFKRRVPVLAFNNFASQPAADSELHVSVLIEFPAEDEEIINEMFGEIKDECEGWECLVPSGCPNAFFLWWHKDPME